MSKKAKKTNRRTAEARFEMPFVVPDPPLANAELGIDRPALRGRDHSYTIDVTVLDTADHRLIRSGVLLAHRVTDGLGDWYLSAQEWAPLMPTELSLPMDAEGDLPDRLANLVRPFRRLAPLGPVAAATLERSAYTIRGTARDGGLVLATLRDDRITVRRAGVAIARVREVRLRPTPVMRSEQRAYIVGLLEAAGGTPVDEFPDLRGLLGAPATGLTDLPEPRPLHEEATLEEFVRSLFAARTRSIVAADLEARTTEAGAAKEAAHERLAAELRGVADQVRGLRGVLQPEWRARVDDDLEVLVGPDAGPAAVREHEDRYLTVLDALVSATRAPRLGDRSHQPAAAEIGRLVDTQLEVLRSRCDALSPDSPDAAWLAASTTLAQVRVTLQVAAELLAKRGRRLLAHLDELMALLEPAAVSVPMPDAETLSGLSASEAFEAGRRHQRSVDELADLRAHAVAQWSHLRRHLRGVTRNDDAESTRGKRGKH